MEEVLEGDSVVVVVPEGLLALLNEVVLLESEVQERERRDNNSEKSKERIDFLRSRSNFDWLG